MPQRNGCIIDTNCLALYIADSYSTDSITPLPFQQANAIFQALVPKVYRNTSLQDFRELFLQYSFYKTSSYIINETQNILCTTKLQAINSKEVFRYGANLFRISKQVQDNFVGFVQVVDLSESNIKWGREQQISFDEFGIEDMSLIVLALELKLPILTLDSRLKAFIRNSLPNVSLVNTEALIN
ncbi:MAG: hypothetical protein HYZ54_05460 [Ignavibacteriae bacterium]|nr:hypothetical protein [Ignavibacteriota bacterium]